MNFLNVSNSVMKDRIIKNERSWIIDRIFLDLNGWKDTILALKLKLILFSDGTEPVDLWLDFVAIDLKFAGREIWEHTFENVLLFLWWG